MEIVDAVLKLVVAALPSLLEGAQRLLSGSTMDEALAVTAEHLANAQAKAKFPDLEIKE